MSSTFISKLFYASLWATIGKWIESGLGILSTLILARLLTPDDFGLVAAATLITAGFEVLSRLGTDQYIIHKQDLDNDTINTAWSIQLAVKVLIACLLIISSLILPNFIEEQRLSPILQTLAIIPLLMGMSNIGIVLLRKELQFKTIAKLEAVAKISSFIVTLTAAYILRDYWAFIYGMLIYYLFYSIGSYVISSYRPELTFIYAKKQFSFSSWTLLKGVVNYLNSKIDQLLITSYLSVTQLGLYSIGQRLNGIPTQLLISPVSTALFSGLAQSLNNMEEFRERTHKIFFSIALTTAPIALCLMLLAQHIVPVALGSDEKWMMVIDILNVLAPLVVIGALNGNAFNILTLIGKVKYLFYFELVTAIISTAIFVVILERNIDLLLNLLQAKVILALSYFLILLFYLCNHIKLSLQRLFFSLFTIGLSSLVTYFIASYIYVFLAGLNDLLIVMLMGIIIFILYGLITLSFIYLLRKKNQDILFIYDKVGLIIQKYIH